MKELLKIRKQETQLLVDASELHSYFDVKTKFSVWIRRLIKKFALVEGQDYNITLKLDEMGNPRPSKKYNLTLCTAKGLCAAENSERGTNARHYFYFMEFEILGNARQFIRKEGALASLLRQVEEEEFYLRYPDRLPHQITDA